MIEQDTESNANTESLQSGHSSQMRSLSDYRVQGWDHGAKQKKVTTGLERLEPSQEPSRKVSEILLLRWLRWGSGSLGILLLGPQCLQSQSGSPNYNARRSLVPRHLHLRMGSRWHVSKARFGFARSLAVGSPEPREFSAKKVSNTDNNNIHNIHNIHQDSVRSEAYQVSDPFSPTKSPPCV
ncbi:hypothetical protein SODALDRAFT_61679 [Sodiomyces alkalinus F11]|uniref:Uncharacterized protein n=1 Tax=Sodiomyces alkalinus (strain CBS 110278 / VKM F-3762 / F11) TaxID=1314773 RepID=A0A3N2PLQ1_SODAK|nr:hypothetical protein SODALDRAFT_61679 [Sodiomyces alkalinus F11]ROT35324.1 hypothetical protein SODALDRAFT_61679 [Sodiomyces alkalinus F11]